MCMGLAGKNISKSRAMQTTNQETPIRIPSYRKFFLTGLKYYIARSTAVAVTTTSITASNKGLADCFNG